MGLSDWEEGFLVGLLASLLFVTVLMALIVEGMNPS